jgi:hypothetical protein
MRFAILEVVIVLLQDGPPQRLAKINLEFKPDLPTAPYEGRFLERGKFLEQMASKCGAFIKRSCANPNWCSQTGVLVPLFLGEVPGIRMR